MKVDLTVKKLPNSTSAEGATEMGNLNHIDSQTLDVQRKASD